MSTFSLLSYFVSLLSKNSFILLQNSLYSIAYERVQHFRVGFLLKLVNMKLIFPELDHLMCYIVTVYSWTAFLREAAAAASRHTQLTSWGKGQNHPLSLSLSVYMFLYVCVCVCVYRCVYVGDNPRIFFAVAACDLLHGCLCTLPQNFRTIFLQI